MMRILLIKMELYCCALDREKTTSRMHPDKLVIITCRVNLLTSKVSLFLWRVTWNGVAVDYNVQSKSIIMVSKCNCCLQGHVETLEHLLFRSELASFLWHFFGGLLQVEVS